VRRCSPSHACTRGSVVAARLYTDQRARGELDGIGIRRPHGSPTSTLAARRPHRRLPHALYHHRCRCARDGGTDARRVEDGWIHGWNTCLGALRSAAAAGTQRISMSKLRRAATATDIYKLALHFTNTTPIWIATINCDSIFYI
jgi:hypothetical protein